MHPKISVITVCYNAEKHIAEAIESIVNQAYDNLEYIIIDGGSKDATLSIIEKYRDKITVLVSEPDNGISDAFNKGVSRATGDIIGICNADDMLTENALAEVAKQYETGIDVLRFAEYIWDSETNSKNLIQPTRIPAVPIQTHLLHMGCWITRRAYQKYGSYDTDFRYCMDYELIRRFISMGATFKYCNYPTGIFRLGGVSQSGNVGIKKEKISICQRYGGGYLGGMLWVYYDNLKCGIKRIISRVRQ